MTKKLKLMDIVIFSFSVIAAITAAGLTIFVELSTTRKYFSLCIR